MNCIWALVTETLWFFPSPCPSWSGPPLFLASEIVIFSFFPACHLLIHPPRSRVNFKHRCSLGSSGMFPFHKAVCSAIPSHLPAFPIIVSCVCTIHVSVTLPPFGPSDIPTSFPLRRIPTGAVLIEVLFPSLCLDNAALPLGSSRPQTNCKLKEVFLVILSCGSLFFLFF